MQRPTMSMTSDAVAAALTADPTAKMRAPRAMLRLREILSATLPAIMPVTAEGKRMTCREGQRQRLKPARERFEEEVEATGSEAGRRS